MPVPDDESELSPLQQQAIEWLMLLRTHELTESETRDFADWLSQDISHAAAFAEAETLFNTMTQVAHLQRPGSPSPPEQDSSRTSVPSATPQTRKRHPFYWLALPLGLAAAWLFAMTMVLPEQSNLWSDILSDYHTGTGEQRSIALSDGSRILLNTNTAISVDYRTSIRQIVLHHGQALFTVADAPARPFEVSAGELQIRALGTVFEVYRKASDDIRIVVDEHAVSTRMKSNGNAIEPSKKPALIKQGQSLRYIHHRRILNSTETADSQFAGAWRQRRVIVNDRPLSELIEEIERYRSGRIFLDSDLKNLRVTGLFSTADPDAAIEKVRKVLHLKETRIGPWWVLLRR